jgi:NNP family nitrate/nitrite transporter-like MFS transporter
MTGLTGAMGNLGGIVYAIIFRFHPTPAGKAFWISGVLAIVSLLISSLQLAF